MRLYFRLRLVAAVLAGCASTAWAAPPMIGGCPVFPANHFWNTPIDQLPVDAVNSTNWVNSINSSRQFLHPDWGTTMDIGIPFVTVPGSQPKVPVTFAYADESDPGPYPIPPNVPVEGAPDPNGDRHALVIDTTNCRLYEIYRAFSVGGGTSWTADSGAVFDLNSNALRPDSWTSADASGLAIFPGLVRLEEVLAGEIAHAIRFTAPQIWGSTGSGHTYIWPARHWSGSLNNPLLPPMGARFRLKASYNISGFDARTQVILRAFKKYGMVLVDGGSSWFFQGVSDAGWPAIVDAQLKTIPGNQFEVVNTSLLQLDINSAQAVQVPDAPTNVSATPGNGQATFTFTAPPDGGSPIVTSALYPAYKVTCGAISGTGSASPITVNGLTNNTPYTCSVAASNVTGVGASSGNVNVTPGQGVLSPNSSVDFNRNPIAPERVTITLTIRNIGSGNTSALSVSLTGPNAASFSQLSTCSGQSLPPDGTCTIDLTWAPLVVGPHSATLTVSGATTSPATIQLSGFGIAPPSSPAISHAVAGDGQAWILFAPPASDGESPITSYTAMCLPAAGSITAAGNGSPILVSGLSNGVAYDCSVHASNNAGNGPESATVSVTPSVTPALGLTGVQSRKFHPGAQDFDLAIQHPVAIDGPVSVEPRAIGAGHTIVFSFNNPLMSAGTPGITLPGTASAAVAGNKEVRVTLVNIPDNTRATVSLIGVSDVNGSTANASASIGFLVGDVSNSRAVNAVDISGVKASVGQPLSATTFRFDLDVSGSVTTKDVSLAKSRSGRAIP